MPINIDHRANIIITDNGLLNFDMTGSIQIPVGTSGQQPTGTSGMIRYNSTLGTFEGFTSVWSDLLVSYTSTDFNTDFSGKSTTDLAEGSNLYYTQDRTDDRVAALIVAGTNLTTTYNDTAGTLTIDAVDTVYTHPSDGVDLGAALTGANVISDVSVNTAGHVIGFATRALTPANIGAATSGHDHTAADITDFDTEVANNSAVTANTAKVTNVTTNLGYTTSASTGIVTSSDGTDATLPAATTSLAGLLTGADKTKLNGVEALADVTDTTNVVAALTAGTNVTISAAGIIAATDTNTTYVSSDFDHDSLTGFVANEHIDWTTDQGSTNIHSGNYTDTNTTYSVGDGGLTQINFTTAKDTKLSGVEALADVTDAINVTAAGALMDSEVSNLAQVKAFNSADYATSAQGTLADNALQTADIGVAIQAYTSVLQNTTASYTTAEETKLSGIETNATADQTAGEIELIVNHDNLIGFVANEHIDWTADQGATNINAGNYTDTVYTHPNDGVDLGAALTGANVISDVTVNVAGHVTGFATRTLTPANIGAIPAGDIALGADTSGNYVSTITGTTNEIEVSGSGTETAGVTIGLPNAVTISGAMTAGSFVGDGSGLTNVNVVATTPPGSPVLGDIWYNSESGGLFIYYTDVTPDSYWVQVGGADGAGTSGSSGASPFVDTGTYVYYGGPRNVGIGTATPTEALHVIGNILASGDVTAYSDESLKTNISTISGAINIVTQLRGVNYTKKDTQRESIGVIAQEVQKVLPNVVHQDTTTGLLSVAYGNMVGVLIEAIKEQQNEITELKYQMNMMITRLDKLDGSN
jgi:hypothetical protein